MRKLKAADLFAGAGGTSKGAEQGGATLVFALNHWEVAVKTHAHNFPNARHVNSRLDACSPSECDAIDILFASPECTHHSRARGGRPTTDQQRAGAWDVMKWVEHHRPSFVVIENVREFEDWGPVSDGKPLESMKGRFFIAWVRAIESAGYRVEWRILNAADYGAATSRDRLFVICRKGNRAIHWPEPTHAKPTNSKQRAFAGMELPAWRSAAEIIDWSIECPSVFARKHPLRDKTLARIEAGVDRFVGPFVAKWDNHSSSDASCVRGVDQPLATLVTKANQGLALPLVASTHFGGRYFPADDRPCPTIRCQNGALLAVPYLTPFFGERGQQTPRTHSIDDGLPTITSHGAGGLVVPFLADVNHGPDGSQGSRTYGINESLGTITTKRGKAVVTPLVVNYYGNGSCSEVSSPLGTITTKDRFAIVPIALGVLDGFEGRTAGERSLLTTMERLGVLDIGFRMLANHELSAAQGFPTDYWFAGTKADVTRQIGNSVSPHVAKSITEALCA